LWMQFYNKNMSYGDPLGGLAKNGCRSF